ncbi:MAG: hypothetical protein ACHQWU_10705 [Gemmatimonadales bacterium]
MVLVAALLILVAAAIVDLHELATAVLVAYAAAVSVVLGTLIVTLIAHLTTATWFRPFRARAELVIGALPALAAVGAVLLLALPTLYPWFSSETPAHAYLNAPFFLLRWVVYWVAWIAVAELLRATQRMHERGEIERAARRFRRIASAGLVVLGVTMTFAAFDWLMSLTPDWQSTIYGVYWFAGGMVGGLALLAVLAAVDVTAAHGPRVSPDEAHSLGKLLLTFVLFWLYIGFSQYIVIWSGDLPREVTWYVARSNRGWGAAAGVLVFGNFVLPFLLLLFRRVKRSRRLLAAIGVVLLALHFLDTMWIVMPGVQAIRWWTVLVSIAAATVVCAALLGAMTLRRPAAAAQPLRTV